MDEGFYFLLYRFYGFRKLSRRICVLGCFFIGRIFFLGGFLESLVRDGLYEVRIVYYENNVNRKKKILICLLVVLKIRF